jgi:transposase
VINVGIDWAEAHHDVCVEDGEGRVLAKGRVPDGIEGVERIHEMLGAHAEDPSEVAIGIELDRGLLVGALVAAGYEVHAVNPLAVSRYRDRLAPAGAKSDPGDARVLAEAMRTDRHLHRVVAGDSSEAEAIKVLARAHQGLVWTRQRIGNQLRSVLREFYPGALHTFLDLSSVDAISVLSIAPTPKAGRALTKTKVRRALASGGRKLRLDERAGEIVEGLRAPQLGAPDLVEEAFGHQVASLVAVLQTLKTQIGELRDELEASFRGHPDAEIITSLPGLSFVLGARVLAEFGDDRTRYSDARARRSYAGTAPITKASGTRKVVLARVARNKRLADACYGWAFSSLQASPGARVFYDRHRASGKTHHQALRVLSNRWVGILHGCLTHREIYREDIGWRGQLEAAA